VNLYPAPWTVTSRRGGKFSSSFAHNAMCVSTVRVVGCFRNSTPFRRSSRVTTSPALRPACAECRILSASSQLHRV
jgi:hypothetical protein